MVSKRYYAKKVEKKTQHSKKPSPSPSTMGKTCGSPQTTTPPSSSSMPSAARAVTMETTQPTANTSTETTTTATTDIRPRRFHPAFCSKLAHFNRRLTPLISVTTGQPHPSFPRTVLAYHLLSSTDLDSIAAHYHQTTPTVRESHEYPKRIPPWVDARGRPVLDIPVETKRRRIGRFIGLKGCDSPDGEGLLAAIEREWDEALAQAKGKDDDDEILRKVGG